VQEATHVDTDGLANAPASGTTPVALAAPQTDGTTDGATNGTASSTVGRAAVPAADAPPAAPKPRRNVRRIAVLVLGAVVVLGLLYTALRYRDSLLYVSTENAQLTGQPVQVGPASAGRIASLAASVGTAVRKGDVLAQVALPSMVGVGQNGTPKMEFLGAADTRVDVTAPIDGVVIAVPSAVGSTVAPGQPVVTLVDPAQLWVNANVEETKVSRLRAGQPVEVHVDALNTTIAGRVESITPATSAVFSLLPSTSGSGNFTKVTQLVPVRIAVSLGNQPSLLGSSVEVKVHVR